MRRLRGLGKGERLSCLQSPCFFGSSSAGLLCLAVSNDLPSDPGELRATIALLQAENARLSATLRVHDLLIETLRARIAKLQRLNRAGFAGGSNS